MSDRSRVPGRSQLALVATMVVVGVAVVALPRIGGPRDQGGEGGPGPGAPDPSAGPPAVMPTATPVIAPSEEAFCARFRRLSGLQGQYAAQPDETGAGLLRDEVDDVLAIGVPDSMGIPARTGYLLALSEIYESFGERLDPRAVPDALPDGADGTSLADPSGAFGTWLAELCPGW